MQVPRTHLLKTYQKVSGINHTAHVFAKSLASQRPLSVSPNVKEEHKKIYFDFCLRMEHPGERIISSAFSWPADTDHMGLCVIIGSSINVDPGDSSITETNILPT